MDCGAILLVARLVNVLALADVLRLTLSLDLALVAGVEHCLALTVAHFAAALLKEGVLHCAVDCVVSCPTLRTLAIITTTIRIFFENQIN